MEMLGMILGWIGLIISIIGGLWLLVLVFSESILLGIASLFCGIIPLIWGVMHLDAAKIPLLLNIGGALIMGVGFLMAGSAPMGIGT